MAKNPRNTKESAASALSLRHTTSMSSSSVDLARLVAHVSDPGQKTPLPVLQDGPIPSDSYPQFGAEERAITTPADLGALVRAARKRRKMSQQSFADLAGVGRRFVSELESGKATLEFGRVLSAVAAAGIDLVARER